MSTKRVASILFAVPLMAVAGSGVASAGEIAGPPSGGFATGNLTPISFHYDGPAPVSGVANSICAFSGLNAYHPAEGGFPEKQPAYPTVQNYGAIVSQGGKAFVDSPGDACNGHTGELAGS